MESRETVDRLSVCYNVAVISSAFVKLNELSLRFMNQQELMFDLIKAEYDKFTSGLVPADRDTALHFFNQCTGVRGGTETGHTTPMSGDTAAKHAENIKIMLMNEPLRFGFPTLAVPDRNSDFMTVVNNNIHLSAAAIDKVLNTKILKKRLDDFVTTNGPMFIPSPDIVYGKQPYAQKAVNATGAAPTPQNGAGGWWSTGQPNPIPVNGSQVGTNQHPTKPINGGVSGHDPVRPGFNDLNVIRCELSVLLSLAVVIAFFIAQLSALVETFMYIIIAVPTLIVKFIFGGFDDSYDYFYTGFEDNFRRYKMRNTQCRSMMVCLERMLRE